MHLTLSGLICSSKKFGGLLHVDKRIREWGLPFADGNSQNSDALIVIPSNSNLNQNRVDLGLTSGNIDHKFR
jgi:hypothetical protein